MSIATRPAIDHLAEICAHLGVLHFIIAPGSRSAPLTVALARHPAITTRVILDERSAGYIALGLAQQLGRPVGVVCTSGTAALNLAPAVVEAFYQQIPLLVLTADRPPEWIDQQDNQAIHQRDLYAPHVRASYELPVATDHPDARWQVDRLMTQAIQLCNGLLPGPVHINVPLREPLYPAPGAPTSHEPQRRIVERWSARPQLDDAAWQEVVQSWQRSPRRLIVAGMQRPDASLSYALRALQGDPGVAVIADITSNLYPSGTDLYHSDMIMGSRRPATLQQLAPDLLITYGGPMVSKYIKQILRQAKPPRHWHLQPEGVAPDTFQSLTQVIPMTPTDFFQGLQARVTPQAVGDYQPFWQELERQAAQQLNDFLAQAPFGEFRAAEWVMRALPAASHLQLGNSMPIRYGNFIAYTGQPLHVNANRGTSGIDGTVSTTVGAALATDAITTLITGDLAFFYDRNALWHEHVPPNLRLVILNNHGGGIFQIIDGPNQLQPAETRTYFLTPQPLTARRTAEDHGLDYFAVADETALQATLPNFFAQRSRAAILEIETDMATNSAVFQQFKQLVATSW
jgi:2-succinyl-5-enolpyruvyl-6-hydroxy-3-cyclohexene-1-carboxylate synthase